MPIAPAIRGLGCLSCLGDGVNDHLRAIDSQTSGLRPLRELQPDFPDIHAGWIKPRSLLSNRRWAPASMAALHVTAQAILDAGWQNDDLSDVPVFASGSRGNLAGWLEPWQDRRPLGLFAASNSIACEPAAAICHHHRIRAPWHFSASGCCAGLDALIDAALHLRVGRARRAIVVAVDLPLVSPVLDAFARTGMFGDSNTPGMQPAEAAAAICLDLEETPGVRITDDISGNDPDARFGGNRPLPVLKEILSRLLAIHIPNAAQTPHRPCPRCLSLARNRSRRRYIEKLTPYRLHPQDRLRARRKTFHRSPHRTLMTDRHIEVSIDAQTLTLFDHGHPLRVWSISTASRGVGFVSGSYRTPTGRFRIAEKIGDGAPIRTRFESRQPKGIWNELDSHSDGILTRILWLDGQDPENRNSRDRFIYIHGTNQESRLGKPASHGCVRMGNQDMIELFDLVAPGTTVIIHPPLIMKHRLIFFDCDSTLSSIEGIDELARARGGDVFR
ncbi:MAG: L,D-transpeptidase family protein, partial [Akkermansiaceae bacterium]|nr:L,D-transpeptidase family protein [Akkermansiaceae bacterium]